MAGVSINIMMAFNPAVIMNAKPKGIMRAFNPAVIMHATFFADQFLLNMPHHVKGCNTQTQFSYTKTRSNCTYLPEPCNTKDALLIGRGGGRGSGWPENKLRTRLHVIHKRAKTSQLHLRLAKPSKHFQCEERRSTS